MTQEIDTSKTRVSHRNKAWEKLKIFTKCNPVFVLLFSHIFIFHKVSVLKFCWHRFFFIKIACPFGREVIILVVEKILGDMFKQHNSFSCSDNQYTLK
jgi:hypothetical protein